MNMVKFVQPIGDLANQQLNQQQKKVKNISRKLPKFSGAFDRDDFIVFLQEREKSFLKITQFLT